MAYKMKQLCQLFEDRARLADWESCRDILAKLYIEYDSVQNAFSEFCKK